MGFSIEAAFQDYAAHVFPDAVRNDAYMMKAFRSVFFTAFAFFGKELSLAARQDPSAVHELLSSMMKELMAFNLDSFSVSRSKMN